MSDPASGPGLPEPAGHGELVRRLRGAASGPAFPQSLLLHGPEGVGKQTLALWTAALLQCESAGPCGGCRHCRLAARAEHPDIHWHFPLARPKRASGRRKLREKLEEARHEALARFREDPLTLTESEGVTGIYMAAVEEIRARAAQRPAFGRRSVFIIGSADRLVPQAANPEAANALLKLLEEPPGYAYLILTSSRPGMLLPTIRSRSLAMRVPPLADDEVAAFLETRLKLSEAAAADLARRAEGSIGRSLRAVAGLDDDEREQARRLLSAAFSAADADRLGAAAAFGASGARAGLATALDGLAGLLRDLITVGAGRPELALDRVFADRIRDRPALDADRLLSALDSVEDAREAAEGNTNPQAVVAHLLFRMADQVAVRG